LASTASSVCAKGRTLLGQHLLAHHRDHVLEAEDVLGVIQDPQVDVLQLRVGAEDEQHPAHVQIGGRSVAHPLTSSSSTPR